MSQRVNSNYGIKSKFSKYFYTQKMSPQDYTELLGGSFNCGNWKCTITIINKDYQNKCMFIITLALIDFSNYFLQFVAFSSG